MQIKNRKSVSGLSMTNSIMAALWKNNQIGKEDLMTHKYFKIFCSDKHKITFRTCISRLFNQKLVSREYNNIIALTERGRRLALLSFIEAELALHNKNMENQEWDGGWRIIFFDIPEKKRKIRDHLRRVIKRIGFREFQRSIWIYPYPVPPFLKELLFGDEIKSYVRFITTNLVDNDQDLRSLFGLKKIASHS